LTLRPGTATLGPVNASAHERIEAARVALAAAVTRPMQVMEVCGTHTLAIGRHGLRAVFPEPLRLLSGPGCPVCVTSGHDIDQALDLARRPGTRVTAFGDMLRVPGASGRTLEAARTAGAAVQVVHSALDALELARTSPAAEVVFLGVGFETASPAIAAAMRIALERRIGNFSVLPSFKRTPPAMEALCAAPDARIEGFLCPGNVSAIIGTRSYEPLAKRVPCVVGGFEALDILEALVELCERVRDGRPAVVNRYTRVVRDEGNPTALALLDELFEVGDAVWRGLGLLPGTGLHVRERYAALDARRRFGLPPSTADDLPPGCACGAVLRGVLLPPECPLFGSRCTPAAPLGPCMVSTEGSCAAYHKYGG